MPTEFSAGRVLGRSLSLLFSNAGAFVLMVVLIHLPIVLLRVYLTTEAASAATRANGQAVIFSATLFLQPLATASVTYGVLRELSGKPARFADCITVGLSRMFAVFLVGIVTAVLTLLGLCLVCVPGFIVSIMLFVAVPAAVVERLSVVDALRRSWSLTKSSWGSVFGVLAFIVALQLGVFGTIVVKFFDLHQSPPVEPTSRAYLITATAASIVMQAIQAITSAVAYNDLRRAREGGETSDFLSVFD
jgi:hypothetical protein